MKIYSCVLFVVRVKPKRIFVFARVLVGVLVRSLIYFYAEVSDGVSHCVT